MTTLLEVNDLRTTFHTARGDMRAVDGVSLKLHAGETLGVVGESGSGKSVLGRTVMGLISQSRDVSVEGQVLFDGRDLHAMSASERRQLWGTKIAMVFQDPMTSLNPVKKVGTHLTESLRIHLGLSRSEALDRAVELLVQVGIPDPRRRAGQYPHELSGGMRQRVVIAMALACSPQLLIADEPTTALDVTVQKQILDLLQELSTSLGMATVLISHDLGTVSGRTDRVAVMYAGRVVETSSTQAVFDEPRHPYSNALIESIPRIDAKPHSLLAAIEGQPPNMLRPPPGCRFAPRCPYATDVCRTVNPDLEAGPATGAQPHAVACHHPLTAAAQAQAQEVLS